MTVLLGSAVAIAAIHTVLGPDHYLPFIVMSKARKWSVAKTTLITVLCGLGHVGSSIAIGAVGVAAGIALKHLEMAESFRGRIAAWLLTAFGLVYFSWGVVKAVRNRPHTHRHLHLGGLEHEHEHVHSDGHLHPHLEKQVNLTPWILFVIFVLGPCEPLIPFLMYPAAAESTWGVALVAGVFGIVTIGTMTGIVLLSTYGLGFLPTRRLERYTHALAGLTILACGVAIQFGL